MNSKIETVNIKKSFSIRSHAPANEVSGQEYKPVYEETKTRIENVFGKRQQRHWPLTPQTCSKCFSVAPAVEAE